MTRLRVTALTHRGAVRPDNQDALVIGAVTACGVTMPDPITCELALSSPVLVAVADGMGGHAAGAVASTHAASTLASATPQDSADVATTLRRIDADLQAMTDPAAAGLGTTVAAVLLSKEDGVHLGVGDSRVYLANGGYLAQISTDHRGPGGGLTQCLGGRTDGSPLRITTEPLNTTGRLLLCSDGLSDLVPLEEMETLLASTADPTRIVKSLWAAAMNASGRDNITIILVDPS